MSIEKLIEKVLSEKSVVYAVFDSKGKCLVHDSSEKALVQLGYKESEIEEVDEDEFWKDFEGK